jgi:tmRNA-binding protein
MSSKSGGRKKSQNEYSVIADNRKATFQYEIEDTFEAGIVLTGSEIKSIRQNKVNIRGILCQCREWRNFLNKL